MDLDSLSRGSENSSDFIGDIMDMSGPSNKGDRGSLSAGTCIAMLDGALICIPNILCYL